MRTCRNAAIWLAVALAVLLLLVSVAGSVAVGDPFYYSYVYSPMVPWAPMPYSYAYSHGYYQPGTHYTSVYVRTTQNTWVAPAPAKPQAAPAKPAPAKPAPPAVKRPSGNPAAPVQRAPAPPPAAPKRPSGNPAAPISRPGRTR